MQHVHKGFLQPVDILRSYGKVAIKAHHKTDCLTEVMIPEAEIWAKEEINLKGTSLAVEIIHQILSLRAGPLAGIPVSLKDTITVGGFDSSVAYSSNTGKPHLQDGPMVKILKDAGMDAKMSPLMIY